MNKIVIWCIYNISGIFGRWYQLNWNAFYSQVHTYAVYVNLCIHTKLKMKHIVATGSTYSAMYDIRKINKYKYTMWMRLFFKLLKDELFYLLNFTW